MLWINFPSYGTMAHFTDIAVHSFAVSTLESLSSPFMVMGSSLQNLESGNTGIHKVKSPHFGSGVVKRAWG
jgi:hypothetical protein